MRGVDGRFSDVPFHKPDSDPEIYREDVFVDGARCFLLHGALTIEECDYYLRETENVGYSSIGDEYPASYRNNWRVLSLIPELTDLLYARIKPFLTRK